MSEYSIGIVVTHFNRVDLCLRALSSVENQECTSIRLVVVDDCSSDNISRIHEFCSRNNWQVLVNKVNSFVNYSRERGMKLLDTDYILYLDDDDYLLPGSLNMFLDGIQQNPLVPHSFLLINNYSHSSELSEEPFYDKQVVYDDYEIMVRQFGIHSCVTPRELLLQCFYDNDLRYYCDLYIWLQVIKLSKMWILHNNYVGVYDHQIESITSNSIENNKSRIESLNKLYLLSTTIESKSWINSKKFDTYFCLAGENISKKEKFETLTKAFYCTQEKMNVSRARLWAILVVFIKVHYFRLAYYWLKE